MYFGSHQFSAGQLQEIFPAGQGNPVVPEFRGEDSAAALRRGEK